MALLTAGYWPTTYWPENYWSDDYWPDYGEVAVPYPVDIGFYGMRYLQAEKAYLTAGFDNGDTVKVNIFRLSDSSPIVSDGACTEIGSTGVFKYLFEPGVSERTDYLWIMDNGTASKGGEIILGGYPDTIKNKVNFIAKEF